MNKWLQSQHSKLKSQIRLFEQTEGYDLLTSFQRQFIINSLFLQERQYRYQNAKQAYQISHTIFSCWYCHASVLALEEGIPNGYMVPNENIPNSFFTDDLHIVQSAGKLRQFLIKSRFPAVVHVNSGPNNHGRMSHHHSCLSLGTNTKGDIVIWEKEGYSFPFRITDHKSLYKEYPKSYYSARPLRLNDSVDPTDERQTLTQWILSLFGL